MKILDRHISRAVTGGSLLTLLVLSALAAFFAVIDQLGDLGGNYGIAQAIEYVLLILPRRAYELFPTAVLLGALLSLGALATHSELIVMRAAGLSVYRITWSVLKAGLILMAIAIFLGEVVAPPAEQLAQNRRAVAQAKSFAISSSGFWARDGKSFIGIKRVLPGSKLEGINVYTFNEQHKLASILTAKSAVYEQDKWILTGVRKTRIEEKSIKVDDQKTMEWKSLLSPDVLEALAVKAVNLSIVSLYFYVDHLKKNKLDASKYELAFWSKLIKPFSTIIMLLVAMPFVFGSLRSSGVGQKLLIGVLIGLGFHLMNQALNHVGVGYGLNPVLSAVLPSILFGAAGLVALKKIF